MDAPLPISSHYLGDAGEHYSSVYQRDADLPGYRYDAAFFAPHLRPDDVLLDFGCGNGGLLRRLAPFVKRADGLEVNPASAAIARESGLHVAGGLDALEPGTYTVILTNHVLEHVRDVPTTLERLRTLLVPGGRLVVRLPIDDPHARKQRSWSRDDIDRHLQTWTPRLFANLLYETGFEVDDARVYASAWHPKLFWLERFGLHRIAFWAVAVAFRRRQLFVRAHRPSEP